jgi:hypothetical protein
MIVSVFHCTEIAGFLTHCPSPTRSTIGQVVFPLFLCSFVIVFGDVECSPRIKVSNQSILQGLAARLFKLSRIRVGLRLQNISLYVTESGSKATHIVCLSDAFDNGIVHLLIICMSWRLVPAHV